MKTYRTNPIQLSLSRRASLLGIVLWAAHYHGGQSSREYRMGCRARTLLERSNEIGPFMVSRQFDHLEPFVCGDKEAPRVYVPEFSNQVKKTYDRLAAITEKDMHKTYTSPSLQ
jgi:hypothetical protein